MTTTLHPLMGVRLPVPVAATQGTLALALLPRQRATDPRAARPTPAPPWSPIDRRQRRVVEEWTRRFIQAAVEIVGGDRPVVAAAALDAPRGLRRPPAARHAGRPRRRPPARSGAGAAGAAAGAQRAHLLRPTRRGRGRRARALRRALPGPRRPLRADRAALGLLRSRLFLTAITMFGPAGRGGKNPRRSFMFRRLVAALAVTAATLLAPLRHRRHMPTAPAAARRTSCRSATRTSQVRPVGGPGRPTTAPRGRTRWAARRTSTMPPAPPSRSTGVTAARAPRSTSAAASRPQPRLLRRQDRDRRRQRLQARPRLLRQRRRQAGPGQDAAAVRRDAQRHDGRGLDRRQRLQLRRASCSRA